MGKMVRVLEFKAVRGRVLISATAATLSCDNVNFRPCQRHIPNRVISVFGRSVFLSLDLMTLSATPVQGFRFAKRCSNTGILSAGGYDNWPGRDGFVLSILEQGRLGQPGINLSLQQVLRTARQALMMYVVLVDMREEVLERGVKQSEALRKVASPSGVDIGLPAKRLSAACSSTPSEIWTDPIVPDGPLIGWGLSLWRVFLLGDLCLAALDAGPVRLM